MFVVANESGGFPLYLDRVCHFLRLVFLTVPCIQYFDLFFFCFLCSLLTSSHVLELDEELELEMELPLELSCEFISPVRFDLFMAIVGLASALGFLLPSGCCSLGRLGIPLFCSFVWSGIT